VAALACHPPMSIDFADPGHFAQTVVNDITFGLVVFLVLLLILGAGLWLWRPPK
jgi:hypothetical protein